MASKTIPVNYWPDNACAKAFWSQHELPPYQELLADTRSWMSPGPGERWLDVGCGGGQLTRALWERSRGRLAEIIGLDCAAANAAAYEKLQEQLEPRPPAGAIRFVTGDLSRGLPGWNQQHFDGVVSGLALQYAESYSPETHSWTRAAYDQILQEIFRVLKPGGWLVFSVNVPEPRWGLLAWKSLGGAFKAARPLHYLKRAWRMWRYGSWLKKEARRGRFHYLPLQTILDMLARTGFISIQHRLSFARQAYVFRCRKPVT